MSSRSNGTPASTFLIAVGFFSTRLRSIVTRTRFGETGAFSDDTGAFSDDTGAFSDDTRGRSRLTGAVFLITQVVSDRTRFDFRATVALSATTVGIAEDTGAHFVDTRALATCTFASFDDTGPSSAHTSASSDDTRASLAETENGMFSAMCSSSLCTNRRRFDAAHPLGYLHNVDIIHIEEVSAWLSLLACLARFTRSSATEPAVDLVNWMVQMETNRSDLREMMDGYMTRLARQFEGIESRLSAMDRRFDGIDARFDKVDERFEKIDQRFEKVDQRFEQVDQRFEQVHRDVAALETRIAHRFTDLFRWSFVFWCGAVGAIALLARALR